MESTVEEQMNDVADKLNTVFEQMSIPATIIVSPGNYGGELYYELYVDNVSKDEIHEFPEDCVTMEEVAEELRDFANRYDSYEEYDIYKNANVRGTPEPPELMKELKSIEETYHKAAKASQAATAYYEYGNKKALKTLKETFRQDNLREFKQQLGDFLDSFSDRGMEAKDMASVMKQTIQNWNRDKRVR